MILKIYLQFVYYLWAKVYDNFVDKNWSFDRKKVIEKLEIKKGDKILEIGVGTGLNLPFYSKGSEVYGIDLSNAMLKKAKQKQTQAKVILKSMDAGKTKFQDSFFNKIIMTYVLRVSPKPEEILKEIIRIIKPQGKIVIVDQFKIKNSLLFSIFKPLKILFGAGKDYFLEDLIRNLPLIIENKERFGSRERTQLVILKRI